MTDYLYWIIQGIGILGYVVGVSAFLQRSDQAFRRQLTVVSVILAIHYIMLGAYAAGITSLISAFRNLAASYTRSIWVMFLFIALMWGMAWPTISHPLQYLTVIGTSLVTYAIFRLNGMKMRFVILLSSLMWIIHNIWAGSIGGGAVEITFAIVNIVTIYRLARHSKVANEIIK
ncbi:YgjV family protein [Zophobihabitans entericus]|uniref:YgjV family protein n=1 Tax=Zophobihabitans entericus TaxID=1635327 RepID=A0A6G9I8W6_9GAMM|nr:YgjV family protein [Zophobihabitans entericus]QIQ20656.1 YgjV family protein [Zophobihabitans entericus]